MSMVDLIITVLQDQKAACRLEGDIVKSTFLDTEGRWRRLMFIVEDDLIYAMMAGTEYVVCFSDPKFDLYEWIKNLREGVAANGWQFV